MAMMHLSPTAFASRAPVHRVELDLPRLAQRTPSAAQRLSGHTCWFHENGQLVGSAAALLGAASISQRRSPRRLKIATSDGKGKSATTNDADDAGSSWFVQVGIFLVYLFWQSGMGIYMKRLLSDITILPNFGLKGIPASFFATGTQQLVGFSIFLMILLVSRIIGKPYTPKRITARQFLLVTLLSASFSANIGTNLLAMSLVPLSLTLVIRACSPLSTAIVQTLVMGKKQDLSVSQWSCLVAGVSCAAMSVIAQSGSPTVEASWSFFFGISMSVFSLVAGAFDFVIKAKLGTDVKLNALETTCYNALPVALCCLLAGSFIAKPVPKTWATLYQPKMTDLHVFQKIFQLNPAVLMWLLFSGVLAFGYNIFVTYVIQKLTPATTAFAGNFNKAAAILFTLIFLEQGGAPGIRGWIVRLSVVGNIAAFTAYNIIGRRRKAAAKAAAQEAEVAASLPAAEEGAKE
mmetsp:Transcript_43661/g.100751  ORF Transcript_43661/g.100751 Transcript_43661/m.100751 type:complete len:462 (-) Transcript_43661:195-1580(-)